MSARGWWLFIVIGWVAVVVASSFYSNPADWMEVRRVHVFDALEGQAPRMEVERRIKRPFRGTWLAEVSRVGPMGVSAVCSAAGQNFYEPSDQLPVNLDLDWWTYPTRCNLPPGEYIVDTVWTIRPASVRPMEIAISSNRFFIKPR